MISSKVDQLRKMIEGTNQTSEESFGHKVTETVLLFRFNLSKNSCITHFMTTNILKQHRTYQICGGSSISPKVRHFDRGLVLGKYLVGCSWVEHQQSLPLPWT